VAQVLKPAQKVVRRLVVQSNSVPGLVYARLSFIEVNLRCQHSTGIMKGSMKIMKNLVYPTRGGYCEGPRTPNHKDGKIMNE
jgi:hypothetical protein